MISQAIRLGLALILVSLSLAVAPTPTGTQAGVSRPADASDAWWDNGWPYRIRVDVSGSGIASASINFTTQLDTLGLNHALLDLRSVRVVPYNGSTPGVPIPYAESYSVMLNDAETTSGWSINDAGFVMRDTTRHTQGVASVRTTVTNTVGGYGYPGVEYHPTSITNWNAYETLVYDVWPQVNASALDQAPDLYWFKLYNACGGSPVTQGGPPLALDRWNYVSVSLNPLDKCWPADGLNLSSITRMEFHTRDNIDGDTDGPNGWWNDGDVLSLWFDDMRLVDQDNGAIRWQTSPGVTKYYIYFDILTHEGHPQPTLDAGLGAATLTGVVGAPEAGGYYHQITGATTGSLQVWAAPSVEKVLRTMAVPVASRPLRIAAAQGEFEPFQIIIKVSSAQTLAVSVSAFSKDGNTIPAPAIHRVDYVNITTVGDFWDRLGWWPDPLWPLNNGADVAFPAGQNQPLWFTVQVPWDAAPGIYQATVTVGTASIPVQLEVWNFSLPRQIHLMSEWGFDWSDVVETYRGTVNGSVQSCYWTLVDALKQDFADHRLIPKGVAWPAGLNYPGGVEYDCNGNLDPDGWGDWDFATLGGKYIHGEDGFNGGYGFPSFLALGPRDNWPPDSLPYSFCGVTRSGVLGSAEFQAKWKQYLTAVDNYIVSAGYDQAAYYHIVNEPQTYADYDIVGQISALTESAAPHLRQMVSEQVEPEMYSYPGARIDIWMPTISNYEPVKSHDRQKNHGEQVWWYYLYGDDPPLPNPILMSHPGIEARITPWLAWAERVDGLLHYSTTDWSTNPWNTPNVTGQDNGDGFFFYPPHKDNTPLSTCGENGNRLVPSIRWENLRDGMEDYEYLWLLAGGKPQVDVTNVADAYVGQLVASRTLFSHVPTDLEATRTAIALALGGPTASKSVSPSAVTPGSSLTYQLVYTHSGEDATLVVTDNVPELTTVITATGPGLVQLSGQTITWTVPVSASVPVTLTIQATAVLTPGSAINTATFSSTQALTCQASVLIYSNQVFLPLVLKSG
jgi:hypothetical protein